MRRTRAGGPAGWALWIYLQYSSKILAKYRKSGEREERGAGKKGRAWGKGRMGRKGPMWEIEEFEERAGAASRGAGADAVRSCGLREISSVRKYPFRQILLN